MRIGGLTIEEASSRIASGEVTPVELTALVLQRIGETDDRIGAFVHLDPDAALSQAQSATDEIRAGRYRGPLHGIPIGIKDIIDVAGVPTAGNARVHAETPVARDAAAVGRLRQAGAIILGKTRTHEYAFGITTPGTSNPWDLERIPGGSSGGSGAALAAGMCLGALGTDTGGSVRIPAALCGIVALKPTFGLVPKSGVVPLSWALDHVGPMARSVGDTRILLSAIAGRHEDDPSTARRGRSRPPESVAGLVVGIPTNIGAMEPAVEASLARAAESLAAIGARISYVETPDVSRYGAAIWSTSLPEAAAYHREDLRATPHLYGDEVRAFLEVGSMFLASDYIAAQRLRAIAKQQWRDAFSGIDVMLSPSVPVAAPLRGQDEVRYPDGTTESFMDAVLRCVSSASLTGLPALSVPAGRDERGLPVALQITARPFEDETALLVGEAIEQTFGRLGTAIHDGNAA